MVGKALWIVNDVYVMMLSSVNGSSVLLYLRRVTEKKEKLREEQRGLGNAAAQAGLRWDVERNSGSGDYDVMTQGRKGKGQ